MTMRSNKNGLRRGATPALLLLVCLAGPTIISPELPCSSVYAQGAAKVRSLTCDFVPESGCPVEPTSIRCELDVDPFDAPMDARVYVDYRNNSDRPVAAVKFRLRFVDAQNRDRGTFHAVDMVVVPPQGSHGIKAKRDFTLHPSVIAVKARVLQVKYADGSDWTSTKMQELAQPPGAPGGGGGGGGPTEGGGPGDTGAPPDVAPAPTASSSVYGTANPGGSPSASPVPNPREYENPPAAAGGSAAGQSYSAPRNHAASAGGNSINPGQGVDSFGGAAPPAQAPPASANNWPSAPAAPAANSWPTAAGAPAAPAANSWPTAAGAPAAPAANSWPTAAGAPAASAPGAPGAAATSWPAAQAAPAAGNWPAASDPSGQPTSPQSSPPGAPVNPAGQAAVGNAPGAAANPGAFPVSRYQGPQPVNTPYSPENDK